MDPSLVDYGVTYSDPVATIWLNVSDTVLGSGINTTSSSANVSYHFLQNNTWSGPFAMNWVDPFWEYDVSEIAQSSTDVFTYNFTARDQAAHEVYSAEIYFDPTDNDPPIILAYGSDYSGDGIVTFWANITDMPGYNASRVERVDLKYYYTDNSDPQTVNMLYNDSLWEWDQYFSWNQTVNYTIGLVKDGSGNINDTLKDNWIQGLVTDDIVPPEVRANLSGFD